MDGAALLTAWNLLKSGTLWHNPLLDPKHPCKGYADANPVEAGSLDAWVQAIAAGQHPAAPTVSTATGRGLRDMVITLLVADPVPPPPAPTPWPIKGCSPGAKIMGVADNRSWELPEIVACFGKDTLIRLDYAGSGSDAFVQSCVDAGLEPLLLIGGTLHTIPTPSTHAAAVKAAAARWKGVCRFVEVGGNEPNQNNQTPQQHADLVKAGYDAAKSVDDTISVLNGGLSPAPNTLTFGTALIPLIKDHVDVFNIHLYEDANVRGSWNNWDRCFHPESLGGAKTLRQTLDDTGQAHVPIASTESGGRADQIGEAAQDRYVINAYADYAIRRARGEKVAFILTYCMRNDENAPGWGLCRTDHFRRPAWAAAHAA